MILKHILLKFDSFKSVNLIKNYSLLAINKSNNSCYLKNSIISKRTFFNRKKMSPEDHRIKDNLPIGHILIYRATLNNYVLVAQYTSMATLIGTSIIFLLNNKTYGYKVPSEAFINSPLVNEGSELIFFTIGLGLINLAVIFITIRIPLRIYFNESFKIYTGVKPSLIPIKLTSFQFKPGQLIQSPSGILPWKQFEYKIKNGPKIILLDQYFRRPQDMNIMLGYAKNY